MPHPASRRFYRATMLRLSRQEDNQVTNALARLEDTMARTALVTGGSRGIGADYDSSKGGIEQVEADLGPIEIVVANAGITRDAPFHKMTPDQWNAVIDTNLTGVFNTVHPVWPGMRERGFGRIVVISSINGQKGQFAQVNYAATKAGDLGIIKSLAQEGAAKGITANAICPGYIATEMVMAVPEKVRESIIGMIPAGRLGEPEEIARCVSFLVSDDASFINGSTISANGGQFFS